MPARSAPRFGVYATGLVELDCTAPSPTRIPVVPEFNPTVRRAQVSRPCPFVFRRRRYMHSGGTHDEEARTKRKGRPHPEEVVDDLARRIVASLKPWSLEDRCFTTFEPKLRRDVGDLVKGGQAFTADGHENSLRVRRRRQDLQNPSAGAPSQGNQVRHVPVCAQTLRDKAPGLQIQVQGGGGWCNVNA